MAFATQDLPPDPPLCDLDLVTCRNLLIYLNPGAVKRAMSLLNSALRNDGYLFLGKSEATRRGSPGLRWCRIGGVWRGERHHSLQDAP